MSETNGVSPREISPEEIDEITVASTTTSDANGVTPGDDSQEQKPDDLSDIPEIRRARVDEKDRYLALHLPPMYTLEEIFNDLAAKAMSLGFEEVVKHLGDRQLRIATVCSGTESPILAMEMFQKGKLLAHFISLYPGFRCGPRAGPACLIWSTYPVRIYGRAQ